jgi:hypothetical protein
VKDEPLVEPIVVLRPTEHHPDQRVFVFGLEDLLGIGQRDHLGLPRPEDLVGAARFSQASAAATQCLQKAPSLPTGQSHE